MTDAFEIHVFQGVIRGEVDEPTMKASVRVGTKATRPIVLSVEEFQVLMRIKAHAEKAGDGQ